MGRLDKRVFSSTVIMIGLLCLSMFSILTPSAMTENGLLDTIIVNADGLTYYSTISLEAGVTYTFEASGTYKDEPEVGSFTDAKYYTKDGWATYHVNDRPPYEGEPTGGLYMEGWALDHKPWGNYNAEHEYVITYVGAGDQVGFWIYDSYYPGGPPGENDVYLNNSGSLTVEIYLGPRTDFENGFNGWQPSSRGGGIVQISTAYSHSGSHSLEQWCQTGGTGGSAPVSQSSAKFPTITQLQQYELSLWVYVTERHDTAAASQFGFLFENEGVLWDVWGSGSSYVYVRESEGYQRLGDMNNPVPQGLSLNEWHYVKVVADGTAGTVSVWLDGDPIVTSHPAFNIGEKPDYYYIHAHANYEVDYIHHFVDDVRISEPHPFSETIEFSGYTWNVESSESLIGPGQNYWSNSLRNVWVDDNGWLHLRITYDAIKGKWYCAEVSTTQPLGYGRYVFYIASRIDNLDQNVVFGLSSIRDDDHEVDIELSRWNHIDWDNAWFTVQPAPFTEDNQRSFDIELTGDYSTHYFSWNPNCVFFGSYHGHYQPKAAPPWNIIQSWPCTQSRDAEGAKAYINLWSYASEGSQGSHPSDHEEVEVVIKEFKFYAPGDVNSNNKCDCIDLFTLARAFGSDSNQPNWNPNADINNDGTVDANDLLLLVTYYGKTN
jgi:hypothetical protein